MIDPIGQQLRAKREQMNLTLRDVEKRTRIPANTLLCLEEADYSSIGGITYACSGLRSYSRCLDMDVGDEIAMLRWTAPVTRDAGVHGGEIPYDIWRGTAPTSASAQAASPTAAILVLSILFFGGASLWMHQLGSQWAKAREPIAVPGVQDVRPQPFSMAFSTISPPEKASELGQERALVMPRLHEMIAKPDKKQLRELGKFWEEQGS